MIKLHSMLIFVAVAAVASCAFAESDPYADRVQDRMKQINSSDKTSDRLKEHSSSEKQGNGARDARDVAKNAELSHSEGTHGVSSSQKPHRDKKKPKHGHKHR